MDVQVYKKDTIPHYNWTTDEIFRNERGVVCYREGPRELNHQTRNRVFTFHTDVIELYWFGKPYSLHIALDRDTGELHYYSNIHGLPLIGEEEISFVDYDLDVVREDCSPAKIIDWEDFERHSELFAYSQEILRMVPRAAEEMKSLLNDFPCYQKPAIIEAFAQIEQGQREFLTQWLEITPRV